MYPSTFLSQTNSDSRYGNSESVRDELGALGQSWLGGV